MTQNNKKQGCPLALVADDDITIRLLARESLEQAGFGVEEAKSGLQALSAFKQLWPDIVLLDVRMPQLDGFKLCAMFRKLPGCDFVPILMMTGLEDTESINRAYEVGATDFITKPINWLILGHRARYMLRSSQTLNALRRSEEKNRALLDAIPDLMFQITQNGIVFEYKAAKSIDLITKQTEFINKRLQDILPDDLADQIMRYMEKAFSIGDIQIFDYHLFKGNEPFYYEIRIVLSGRDEVLVIIRDITDHMRAEKVKKELEAQLHQVQNMEAIGTLAGGIAHDFNNLLMSIQGCVNLISMDIDSGHPHFKHLKGIEKTVKKGSDLTGQLLGFAKGGKYEVRPTDLNDLIQKSIQIFSRTNKEIRIHKKYQEDIWTVEVDRGQIDQVLLNLYINAWQAMPGGGDLYLKTENTIIDEKYLKPFNLNAGKYVKITVTDTGVGMDEDIKRRIFEPFFTTKEMGRGAGLGLASAYGIIKNHGGIINVYSAKSEGSTFNIYLPASEQETAEEGEMSEEILRGKETILLVDDEEMIVEVGEEIMTSLGYKVLSARGGKEAVEIYKKNSDRIDIVILDMIMPDISGKETYYRLKEINPAVKVLLSSGYSENDKTAEILKCGCNGFIQKPFSVSEISQRIRGILD